MDHRKETRYVTLWEENGIIHAQFPPGMHMNLEIAKEIVGERLKFTGGRDRLVLIDMRNIKSVTRDAREYMGVEGSKGIRAGAMLIGSALTRFIGNIFLAVNKPQSPAKLFTNEEDARRWLNEFT